MSTHLGHLREISEALETFGKTLGLELSQGESQDRENDTGSQAR